MRHAALALLCFAVASFAAPGTTTEVLLIATTDLHAAIGAEGEQGGMARVARVVGKLRLETPASVLVDLGDAFEGCPLADYYATVDTTSPHPLAHVMNRMGYAAMALGNHEFSYGTEFVERIARDLAFPVLSANARAANAPWETHRVVEAEGIRILIVGVTTPWTALSEGPWLPGVRFSDQVECLRTLIPRLRAQERPDVVCVLAHTGKGDGTASPEAENAGAAIARMVPGIDVLFLGHTHVTVHETAGATVMLQAGSRGAFVATARLTLARKGKGWRIAARSGELVPVEGAPDSTTAAVAREALAPVTRWLDEEVGYLPEAASAVSGALRLDPVTRLIGQAMTAEGGDAALVALPAEDLALRAGPLHRSDLYRLQPYLNRSVTLRLSRGDLCACLEQAASVWAPYAFDGAPKPATAAGRRRDSFLVACGLSYVLDYTAPPGQRLRWLRRSGRPLPDSLDVAVSSYHATGPAGYEVLRHAPVVSRSRVTVRDALVDYLARSGPHRGTSEAWWSLPSYRGSWAQPAVDLLLARSGVEWLAELDWWGGPSPECARAVAQAAWGGPLPEAVAAQIGALPLTRGALLASLVRSLPSPACTPGSSAARFLDVKAAPQPSVWDSVVSSGLVAFFPEDTLAPDRAVCAAELAAFVINARYRALTIAASNDFHGHLEANPKRGYGGIEAMTAWAAHARRANPEGVILVDAGDAMQGTPLSNLFYGSSTIGLYRRAGYDALAVGNHDFDWGQDILRARIAEAGFPFLGANVWQEGATQPPPWLAPFTIIDRGGARVAIVGLSTPETPWVTLPANVEGLVFEEPGMVFERILPSVQAASPALIVVLGHMGLEERDGDLQGEALAVTESAAGHAHVFFNGHTHQSYARTIKGLPHLQGGSYGRAYAVATAWVDRLGRDQPWVTARLERLDPGGFHDEETAALVAAYRAELAPKTEVVITDVAAPVSRELNEAGESPMGRLIAESQRWMAGTPIALMNTGGVRSDLDAGPVTWQELFTVQPFANTLVKVTLSGRDLRATLEQGMFPGGTNLQLAGLEVWMDPTKSFGQRVVRARLEDGTALDPAAEYTLTVNNFMATGGDGFTVLRDSPRKYDTGIVDLDAIIAYLKSLPSPVVLDLPPRMHLAK